VSGGPPPREIEPFPADDLRRRLAGRRIGRRLLSFGEVDSTNDLAWKALEEAARPEDVDGLVVLASFQARGRGSRGRAWVSPPGTSLLASVLLVPPAGSHPVAGLTAAGGCAVAAAVREGTGLSPSLKWPNDVLLDGRKVAGVLVEARSRPGSGSVYVVGVGLNANSHRVDFPESLRETLTTVREETGCAVDLGSLAERFLGALEEREGALREGNAGALEEEFVALLGLVGRDVEARLPDGEVSGRLEGLSFREGLRIRALAGVRALPCEGVLSLAGR